MQIILQDKAKDYLARHHEDSLYVSVKGCSS